jgi:hypothetical protein
MGSCFITHLPSIAILPYLSLFTEPLKNVLTKHESNVWITQHFVPTFQLKNGYMWMTHLTILTPFIFLRITTGILFCCHRVQVYLLGPTQEANITYHIYTSSLHPNINPKMERIICYHSFTYPHKTISTYMLGAPPHITKKMPDPHCSAGGLWPHTTQKVHVEKPSTSRRHPLGS